MNQVSYFNVLGESIQIKDKKTRNLSKLVDRSNYEVIAQALPTTDRQFTNNYYAQGYAIGKVGDTVISASCFSENTDETKDLLVLYNFNTGKLIGRYNVTMGHANSLAFCTFNSLFYVACSTSDRPFVYGIDINGVIKKSWSGSGATANAIPWAITSQGKYLYVLISGNRLIKINADTMEQEDEAITLPLESTLYTYQGMFSDEDFLYIPCGNTTLTADADKKNSNLIMVFTYEGEFQKYIDVMFPLEVEECDIYNGRCYMQAQTQHSGLICEIGLYQSSPPVTNNPFDKPVNIVYREQTINIDQTYTDFFMDGSTTNPCSSIVWFYLFVKSNTTYVILNFLSDATHNALSVFSDTNYTLNVRGNNHKLLRINYNSSKQLIITNTTFICQNGSVGVLAVTDSVVMTNVTIGEPGSSVKPSRAIDIRGNFEIATLILNCNVEDTNAMLYIFGNGYIRQVTVNATNAGRINIQGCYTADSTFPIDKYMDNNFYNMSFKPCFTRNKAIDITNLRFPCAMSFSAGSVAITGVPSGIDATKITAIICDYIATNKALITIVLTDKTIHQYFN